MLWLLLIADLTSAVASAQPAWAYHSQGHDLVVYADGRALYRSDKRLLEAHVPSLLSKDELRTFEKSSQSRNNLQFCKTPATSLRHGDHWIYFCFRQPVRPPAVARLFARLDKYVPPHAKPWSPSRYHVWFAMIRGLADGVPLDWPRTLPRPAVGSDHVLVEANLLPEVKRYAKADPAAKVSWSPALPGIDDL